MSVAGIDTKLSRLFTPAVTLFGSQNDRSGGLRLKPAGAVPAPHCALIRTALILAPARNVKSTGWAGLGTVNVAVTGAVVPNGNAGIVTFALVALTTE